MPLKPNNMKTTIISQTRNPFLEREEFVISISDHDTPTVDDIVADLGKKPELTVVRRLSRGFGEGKLNADVLAYDSIEAKERYTIIPQKVRKKMEEERRAKEAEEKKRKEEEAKAAAEAAAQEAEQKATTDEQTTEEPNEATEEAGK